MRDIDSGTLTALQSGTIVKRQFVWITAHDLITNDPVSTGFWDDVGNVTATVIDADTQTSTTHDYSGSDKLVAIDAIPLTDDLTIRQVNVRLNILDTAVNNFVRGYNLRNAGIQIHTGIFNPVTFALVAAAKLEFVGFVDGAPITTPAIGGEAYCELQCTSATLELTRTSSDTRSDESQKARHAGDRFYKYAAVMGQRQIFWGTTGKGSVAAPAAASNSPPVPFR